MYSTRRQREKESIEKRLLDTVNEFINFSNENREDAKLMAYEYDRLNKNWKYYCTLKFKHFKPKPTSFQDAVQFVIEKNKPELKPDVV